MEEKLEYGGFIEVTMEDMKEIHHSPTVDEVVQALECCQSKEKKCKECPLHEFGNGCLDVLIANSHCIVQIGKSEIDRKNDVIDWLSKDIESLQTKVDELAELEDKIEQGTLIELPCKVGDTVYVIYQYDDFMGTTEEPFIEKDTVSFFVYYDNKIKIVPSNYAERSDYWYTTIDILLTREEAEKRLKELQE